MLKMPDVNYVIIAGNLTKDPTFRRTTNGVPVANFPLACSRKFKDNSGHWKEEVCYVGIVAWYKLAESCYENLQKGSAILVDGELQSRSWKTENGNYRNIVEIKARRIQFLNRKVNDNEKAENEEKNPSEEPESVEEDQNEKVEETSSEEKSEQDQKEDESNLTKYDFGYDDLKI